MINDNYKIPIEVSDLKKINIFIKKPRYIRLLILLIY